MLKYIFLEQTHIFKIAPKQSSFFIISNFVTVMFNIVLIVSKSFEQISQ
jgi:hypothetical protein